MDSQSMLLLSRQLAIGYYEGPYAIPSGPDFSYAEYTRIIAARQADSDIARKERAYWFSRLDTLPGPLRLPHKNGATMTVQHPGFRNQLHRIDSARWAAVRHQITSRGLEPSTVLMVVFAEMLSMQSGQNHFCFNVKFQDRVRGIHDEVDDIVGNFDAAMLAEMDFRDGGEMLVQRARRVQKMVLEDLAHSSLVTATQVTAELNKRRDTPHKTYSPVTFESKFPLVRKLKKMDSQDRMFLFEPLVEENVTYHNHATAGMELDHQVRTPVIIPGICRDCH
ncbi:uncharacterized protein EV422DRAFT_35426 [Fimicolochytrium jonesii]|uniref:uncharacterized protein n=1 Tax=Fimicolochytrium jonesii TaxID=1396493 RepID=UPI0022FF1CEF|nr:uncharacterized protein EV422DRAFT_35426 [Fimicolochytrium jonesii]KAI8821266.1 hypothetical protein EV422DRAFT_35426 [Fimicolochytrium jonesii]